MITFSQYSISKRATPQGCFAQLGGKYSLNNSRLYGDVDCVGDVAYLFNGSLSATCQGGVNLTDEYGDSPVTYGPGSSVLINQASAIVSSDEVSILCGAIFIKFTNPTQRSSFTFTGIYVASFTIDGSDVGIEIAKLSPSELMFKVFGKFYIFKGTPCEVIEIFIDFVNNDLYLNGKIVATDTNYDSNSATINSISIGCKSKDDIVSDDPFSDYDYYFDTLRFIPVENVDMAKKMFVTTRIKTESTPLLQKAIVISGNGVIFDQYGSMGDTLNMLKFIQSSEFEYSTLATMIILEDEA